MAWSSAAFLIAVVQGTLLLAGILACLVVLRRVGSGSVYGRLFFLNALGLWLLFSSFLLFNHQKLFTGWEPSTLTLGHWVKLTSYALIASTFLAMALRFGAGARIPQKGFVMAIILGVPTLAAFLAGAQVFAATATTGYRVMNLAYIVLDGLGIGTVLYCFLVLLRLGDSILGRFYLLFGAAVLLNAIADMGAAKLSLTGGPRALAPDLIYAAAGVALVASFVTHARALAAHASDARGIPVHPYESLGLSREEKALAAYVHLHHDILGSAAVRQLEAAAWDASLALKRPVTLRKGTSAGHGALLAAPLAPEEHRTLLRHLRNRYQRIAGATSTALGARVAATFGREYEFLAR